jgi:hypothetical protein
MTQRKDKQSTMLQYRKLMLLQERTFKFLKHIELDEDLLDVYQRLLRYLRTRNDEQISKMLGLGGLGAEDRSKTRTAVMEDSDSSIENWSLEQVRERLAFKSLPRQSLERIAAIRFGVTRGALSTLRGRDALVRKLTTLIENESTHGAIATAVRLRKDNTSDL